MIALTLAAQADDIPLWGVSATGMGRHPVGGPAEGLSAVASAQATDMIAFPPEQGDAVMSGPPWTYDATVLPDAHKSYAPAPAVELMAAPRWSTEKLPQLVPRVRVPIHDALAQSTRCGTAHRRTSRDSRRCSPPRRSRCVARGTGHSIDHHRLGRALHLRQLAFADECRV